MVTTQEEVLCGVVVEKCMFSALPMHKAIYLLPVDHTEVRLIFDAFMQVQ